MDSTPPAIAKSISPARIARAIPPTASRPDAQSRLTVMPGTVSGNPASNSAMRATLPIVFTGLIGAAICNFVQRAPVGLGIAFHQRLDGSRGQIVRTHLGQ